MKTIKSQAHNYKQNNNTPTHVKLKWCLFYWIGCVLVAFGRYWKWQRERERENEQTSKRNGLNLNMNVIIILAVFFFCFCSLHLTLVVLCITWWIRINTFNLYVHGEFSIAWICSTILFHIVAHEGSITYTDFEYVDHQFDIFYLAQKYRIPKCLATMKCHRISIIEIDICLNITTVLVISWLVCMCVLIANSRHFCCCLSIFLFSLISKSIEILSRSLFSFLHLSS